MCMGIATANSVLLVSFAREGLAVGLDAATAALDLRAFAVLMTALAIGIFRWFLPLAKVPNRTLRLGAR
jgi:multidrug efflux pump subunit AcrB